MLLVDRRVGQRQRQRIDGGRRGRAAKRCSSPTAAYRSWPWRRRRYRHAHELVVGAEIAAGGCRRAGIGVRRPRHEAGLQARARDQLQRRRVDADAVRRQQLCDNRGARRAGVAVERQRRKRCISRLRAARVRAAERDFAQRLVLDRADALLGQQQARRRRLLLGVVMVGASSQSGCVGEIDRLVELQPPAAEIEDSGTDR